MAIGKHLVCSVKTVSTKKTLLLEIRNKKESLLLEESYATILDTDEVDIIRKWFQKSLDAYACLGVLQFHIGEDLCLQYIFFVTGCSSVGKVAGTEIYRITNCSYVSLQAPNDVDARINDVQKLLMSGCFYFSVYTCEDGNEFIFNLSSQKQEVQDEADGRFFWNFGMYNHVKKYGIETKDWFVQVMCGGVEIRTIYVGAQQVKACLISRLSCERAGTRFNVRGLNDDGHVANFVETEQLIMYDKTITSFIQTRGSVPLFWEQPGFQAGSHRVRMSRGFEASSSAFDRHVTALKQIYGYQLLVNLLGRKEGEAVLSTSYRDHLKASSHNFDTHMIAFDYNYHCSGGKSSNIRMLMDKANPSLENFKFFTTVNDEVKHMQVGTIRTNCIDCLDRTNAVQTEIGVKLLLKQLESIGVSEKQSVSRFLEAYKTLWQLNGDHISRIYSGTGAMESGAKGTIASKLHDGAVSVKRTIRNNFFDGSKQEAIDILLLGNIFVGRIGERARALLGRTYLHSSPRILKGLCAKSDDFISGKDIRVSVGTWNVNGGKHFRSIAYKHQSMHDWLLDYHKLARDGVIDEDESFDKPTDIFAIGFEELVDLNTSNILSTSSGQKKEWGAKLQEIISRDHPYVLVTAEQLVGVCLFVFVRIQHVPYIRDVAVTTIKTGLKGNAGNKGAVGIRMLFHSTSLCFLCGHYAAGQSNITARNNDYHDITRRMVFPMELACEMVQSKDVDVKFQGSCVSSHDYVFWCGDFNYRIDLPNNEVKELVKYEEWDTLLENDQLMLQKADGKVFNGFQEGAINFAPTYKYDLFSDDYDTSEKMRTPAWTDRVLWKRRMYSDEDEDEGGSDDEDVPPEWKAELEAKKAEYFNPGRIMYYGRAELKTSDHRPVIACIDIEIEQVDHQKLTDVHEQVMHSFGPADPTVIIHFLNTENEAEGIREFDLDVLMDRLTEYGKVIMLRLAEDDKLYATFADGEAALESLELDEEEMCGVELNVYLRSTEMLEVTDQTILSLMYDATTGENIISTDDNHDTFQRGQRKMSEILTATLQRSNSILQPEKLNEQEDFIEEVFEEDDDDESAGGDVENDNAMEALHEIDHDEEERLKKENMLKLDSDDEEEINLGPPSQNKTPNLKKPEQEKSIKTSTKPQRPPGKPEKPVSPVTIQSIEPPKRNTRPPPSRPEKPSTKPGRPKAPMKATEPSQIILTNEDLRELEKPTAPSRPKVKPQRPPSSYEKPIRPPMLAKDKPPNQTGLPERPKPYGPGRPAPPPQPSRPKQDNAPNRAANASVKKTDRALGVEKDDDNVSTPFNIQHLMHVDASNVDDFIAKMSKQLGVQLPPTAPAKPTPASKPAPPRRHTVASRADATRNESTSSAEDLSRQEKARPHRPKSRPVSMAATSDHHPVVPPRSRTKKKGKEVEGIHNEMFNDETETLVEEDQNEILRTKSISGKPALPTPPSPSSSSSSSIQTEVKPVQNAPSLSLSPRDETIDSTVPAHKKPPPPSRPVSNSHPAVAAKKPPPPPLRPEINNQETPLTPPNHPKLSVKPHSDADDSKKPPPPPLRPEINNQEQSDAAEDSKKQSKVAPPPPPNRPDLHESKVAASQRPTTSSAPSPPIRPGSITVESDSPPPPPSRPGLNKPPPLPSRTDIEKPQIPMRTDVDEKSKPPSHNEGVSKPPLPKRTDIRSPPPLPPR